MWPRRPKKKRLQESTYTQLTILRTHMAGQAGDLSTMRLQLGMLADRLGEIERNHGTLLKILVKDLDAHRETSEARQ